MQDPIIVVKYDPHWTNLFNELLKHIRDFLGEYSDWNILYKFQPGDCTYYEDLKYKLVEKLRNNRLQYIEMKTPIIWDIMIRADKWNQETYLGIPFKYSRLEA